MKTFTKIFLLLFVFIGFFAHNHYAYGFDENLNTGLKKNSNNAVQNNTPLKKLGDWSDTNFTISRGGEKWIYYTLVRIAKDVKNLMFWLAGLYFIILVLKLILSEASDENIQNFRKWIVWITIWLIVMQLWYSLVNILYDRWVSQWLAFDFWEKMIKPLISFLETGASFLFIALAIYAFYTIILANGNEEKIKAWKMSVVYSIVWFIIIRFARTLVDSTYGTINCSVTKNVIFQIVWNNCLNKWDLSGVTKSIVNIINWMNSLVGIAVVIIIIYTGLKVILSTEEDKIKNAKMSLIYIAIWLWLLFTNYLILTFFIIPSNPI